jgi:flagellar biosynthesis/type III secretory pathway protein FliH
LSDPTAPPPWRADGLLRRRTAPPVFSPQPWVEAPPDTPLGQWRGWAPTDLQAPPQPAPTDEPLLGAVPALPEPMPQPLPDAAPAWPGQHPSQHPAWQQALEVAVAEREAQAYARGLAEGEARGRQAEQAALQPLRHTWQRLHTEWQALTQDPLRWQLPLRRLALHLADQLLRAEWQGSGQAVERLVQQALEGLGPRLSTPTVALHPQDLARLQAGMGSMPPDIEWLADASLRPGSLRVRLNDTVLEDLIEHRLEALARPLLGEVAAAQTLPRLLERPWGADTAAASAPEAERP